jgi:hypothetical protein
MVSARNGEPQLSAVWIKNIHNRIFLLTYWGEKHITFPTFGNCVYAPRGEAETPARSEAGMGRPNPVEPTPAAGEVKELRIRAAALKKGADGRSRRSAISRRG